MVAALAALRTHELFQSVDKSGFAGFEEFYFFAYFHLDPVRVVIRDQKCRTAEYFHRHRRILRQNKVIDRFA